VTKARTNADNVTADIAGITAGTGITGGGTSGTVTITNDMATTIAAAGDLIYGTANDAYAALSLGTAGKVLKVNSGATAPEWAVDPTTDVVTTAGDLIYGTGADAVARLGIGTAGQLLKVNSGATAPEWGAAPESGSMTEIASGSLSGSSVSITSIPSTYKNLVLEIRGALTNATYQPYFTLNNDTASRYNRVSITSNGTSVGTSTGAAEIDLSGGNSLANADPNTFTISIPDYASTTRKNIFFYGQIFPGGSSRTIIGSGSYNQSVAVSSLQIKTSSGSYNGGTYILYGVK
jgi:hypothetical protein